MEPRSSYESTGTEALDTIIGNGVTILNALILVNEVGSNEYYNKPIQRCYIAKGLDKSNRLFLAGPNTRKLRQLMEEVPAKSQKRTEKTTENKEREESDERFGIAWRYQTAPVIDSNIRSINGSTNADRCEIKFDLSKNDAQLNIEELISSEKVIIHDWQDQQPSFAELWNKIYCEFAKIKGEKTRKSKEHVLRILLTELSSPIWADGNLLPQFCAHLKAFCRRYKSTAMLSLDSSLLIGNVHLDLLHQYVDAAFQLQRMDEHEQKALCLRHRIDGGRFYIHKLPTIRSAAPASLPVSLDLLFALKKCFFEIKLLHLPPATGADDINEAKKKISLPKTNCQSFSDQF